MAIIGHGDIASVLVDRPGITFFASGVSNSLGMTAEDHERELKLLMRQDKEHHLVYFSSLCVYYGKGRYFHHKQFMEDTVKSYFKRWTIVRLGNITWGKNPHTLLNYLRDRPDAERRNEIRYLVDKEEFLHWMEKIRPEVNDIMNIPGKMVNVKDLVVA